MHLGKYICMSNVASSINAHNKQPSRKSGCNYVKKDGCPLIGNCLDNNMVYRGRVGRGWDVTSLKCLKCSN